MIGLLLAYFRAGYRIVGISGGNYWTLALAGAVVHVEIPKEWTVP